MSNQTFAPVNVTITPQRGGNERGPSTEQPEEQKDPMTSLAATVSGLFQAVQQMQQSMAQQSQRMAELTQREGFQAGAAHRPSSQTADTLPTPVSAVRHARFTVRAPQPHRISFGMPAVAESPGTPPRSERVEEAAAAAVGPARQSTEAKDRSALKEALSMAHKRVESFYADSVRDKDNYTTVTSFVEKIETVMGDCYLPSHLRLTMVRWFLQEGALRWMNKKLVEMEAAADREGRDLMQHPLDWDNDVRSAFIQAHMGTDTVELWLAKLSVLELDEKKRGAARNPIELESQFDNVARHVYPYHVADDDRSELLLASKYSEIISRCQPDMYAQIVYSTKELSTLKDWKEALVRVWSARERVRAATSVTSQQTQQSGGGRGGYGGQGSGRARGQARGGYGGAAGRGALSQASQPAVSAMDTDRDTRKEGQLPTEYGENEQQLSAADGGRGGKGGRGGRGGRGRSEQAQQPRPQLSDAQLQQLRNNKQCFRCGQVGHRAQGCLNAWVDLSTLQSNEQADQ